MTTPKTNKAEVLYLLIIKGKVTGFDFSFVDYRKRLSELRNDHLLAFDSIPTKFTNKRGKQGICSTYVLTTTKSEAVEIYNKINK